MPHVTLAPGQDQRDEVKEEEIVFAEKSGSDDSDVSSDEEYLEE